MKSNSRYDGRDAKITFENVQADPSKLIDVGMVNFGEKANFRWLHGIPFWQEQLKLEDTVLKRGLIGAIDCD